MIINGSAPSNTKITKLKEFEVETQAETVSFDISDIDWSQWQAVYIDIMALTSAADTLALYFNDDASSNNAYWKLNSTTGDGGTLCAVSTNTGDDRVWANRITMPVGKQAVRSIQTVTGMGCGIHKSLRYSQLETLHLKDTSTSVKILPGTKIIMWGQN